LRDLITSDYPKLEILVLDDQSHDRTPEIIRSFAHDGVRFVKGETPPDGWLAKNWAYQQLYAAASGELLVFCGVDISFEPAALRGLVTTMLAKKEAMFCIIPNNEFPAGLDQQNALLLQPLRYAWELCLPRKFFKRPPVLSSCWIVTRKLLDKQGDFSAVASSLTPESHFAGLAAVTEGYSFVQAAAVLGVHSLKTTRDQWDTAVRTRYPQLHKRPEMVFVLSTIELLVFVIPLIVCIVALVHNFWLLAILTVLASIATNTAYTLIVRMTYQRFFLRSIMTLPFAAMLDVYIRHESMWRYEFGSITWKGRNVTFPVMHVIPRLPKLP
jgi:chlorobactene glucosyltransferase